MIAQEGNTFVVYTPNGMILGKFKTKKVAEERLNTFKKFLGDNRGESRPVG